MFAVVREGLTAEQGAQLAEAFRTPNAVRPNGFFSFADPAAHQRVPLTAATRAAAATGAPAVDEEGRPVHEQRIDRAALERLRPVADEVALRQGQRLLDLGDLGEIRATPRVGHTELTLTDAAGGQRSYPLDTVVSYDLSLAGLPVSGQGAKLRLTVGPDGRVTQVAHALRAVERSGEIDVISPDAAREACTRLYGEDVRQGEPTLGYPFPELTERATVRSILPQYTCDPLTGGQAHRLVPAAPGQAPAGKVGVSRSGASVSATVAVEGGTAPYTYQWSSSTTVLDGTGERIEYRRLPRDRAETAERLTVEVTDANGLTATGSVQVDGDGTAGAELVPGGGGFGALSIAAGIEQTIDEWQCAQASANGFRSVLAQNGVGTAFDFRGANAWERDFKEPWDGSYVDNVDATWYTGHGSPSGFTFKGAHDDGKITPSDARWGNKDLEWLQLESCQVLKDTNGKHDYFGRWKQAFQGLHMMNGFDTLAYCVGGGTGATFASYLFPMKFGSWTLRPAYRVQAAWAAMAIDREPNNVRYRSVGLIRPDGVTNIGDHFWGQGPTGPDIKPGTGVGMWSISGVV